MRWFPKSASLKHPLDSLQTSSPTEESPPPPPSLHTAYITLEWKVSKIPSAWIPGETHIFHKGMFLTETAPVGNSSWLEGSTTLNRVQAQPGRNDYTPTLKPYFIWQTSSYPFMISTKYCIKTLHNVQHRRSQLIQSSLRFIWNTHPNMSSID